MIPIPDEFQEILLVLFGAKHRSLSLLLPRVAADSSPLLAAKISA